MLEYFKNSTGGTLSRGEYVNRYRKNHIQEFLDGIAAESDCALTADIDFYDMGDEIFPSVDLPPSDTQKKFLSMGYDVVMYRYPDFGQRRDFVGRASTEWWIQFPITSADENNWSGAPWISVIWHEWLHTAVFAAKGKKIVQELPPDDVHFNFMTSERYKSMSDAYARAMTFYRDLTGGRVTVNGPQTYGFSKSDWAWIGSPSKPKHFLPAIHITSADWDPGVVNINYQTNSTGSLIITARKGTETITSPVIDRTIDKSFATLALPAVGEWEICANLSVSPDGYWDKGKDCKTFNLTVDTEAPTGEVSWGIFTAQGYEVLPVDQLNEFSVKKDLSGKYVWPSISVDYRNIRDNKRIRSLVLIIDGVVSPLPIDPNFPSGRSDIEITSLGEHSLEILAKDSTGNIFSNKTSLRFKQFTWPSQEVEAQPGKNPNTELEAEYIFSREGEEDMDYQLFNVPKGVQYSIRKWPMGVLITFRNVPRNSTLNAILKRVDPAGNPAEDIRIYGQVEPTICNQKKCYVGVSWNFTMLGWTSPSPTMQLQQLVNGKWIVVANSKSRNMRNTNLGTFDYNFSFTNKVSGIFTYRFYQPAFSLNGKQYPSKAGAAFKQQVLKG